MCWNTISSKPFSDWLTDVGVLPRALLRCDLNLRPELRPELEVYEMTD